MSFIKQPLGLKEPRVISKRIRDSAKYQECTMRSDFCNHDPYTVVFCHAPVRRFGLGGIGMKVPDIFGYYGCHACHMREADHGWDDILRAMCETQMRLLRSGIIEVKK